MYRVKSQTPSIFYESSLWKEYPGLNDKVSDFPFFPEGKGNNIGKEERISISISKLLKRYFIKNPDCILTFVCNSQDDREIFRFNLFTKWFSSFNNNGYYPKEDFHYSGDFNILSGIIMKKYNKKTELVTKAYKEIMAFFMTY